MMLVDLVRSDFFVYRKKILTKLTATKDVHTMTGVGSPRSATCGESIEAITDMKLRNPYDDDAKSVGKTEK